MLYIHICDSKNLCIQTSQYWYTLTMRKAQVGTFSENSDYSQTLLPCLAIRCPWCLVIKSKTQWTTRVQAGCWLGWAGVATSVRIKVMQDTGDQRTPAPHLHTLLQLQSWEHLSHSLLVSASKWFYAIRPFGLINYISIYFK